MAAELPRLPSWADKPKGRIPYLSVMKDGKEIQTILLHEREQYVFGLGRSCDVVLENPSLSQLHAAIIHHNENRSYIVDLKSSAGTFLNGSAVTKEPKALKEGFEFSFGLSSKTYVYHQDGGNPASPSRYMKPDFNALDEEAKNKRKAAEAERARPSAGNSSSNTAKNKEKDRDRKEDAAGEEKVSCCHLLVKHNQSRNPSSWKESKITRTVEEARAILSQLEKKLRLNGGKVAIEDFKALAAEESDCSSYKRGGDLGPFERKSMQKAFSDVAFALAVGEMSSIVASDSGLHLILRYK